MHTVTRTIRFWLDGDFRHWDFAAKQSRLAFNGAIRAFMTGKNLTEAGRQARKWAPAVHSQISRGVCAMVARPSWTSYCELCKRAQKDDHIEYPTTPQARSGSFLVVPYNMWSLNMEEYTVRFNMWSSDVPNNPGPQDYRLHPFSDGYERELWESAVESPKSGQIRYHDRREAWYMSFPTKQPAEPWKEDGGVAGIDLGFRRHFAVISAPGVRKCEFWRWSEIRDRDRRDHEMRQRMQAMKKRGGVEQRRDKTQCYRRDYLRKTTAEIVEWCREHNIRQVNVEDLEGIRERGEKWRSKQKRELNMWPYRWFYNHLETKLEEFGIRVREINPAYTSQTCSECGYQDKRNRRGGDFKCHECGYEQNADLNAANNIAVAT